MLTNRGTAARFDLVESPHGLRDRFGSLGDILWHTRRLQRSKSLSQILAGAARSVYRVTHLCHSSPASVRGEDSIEPAGASPLKTRYH